MEDVVAMQQAARERVRRMQERSRKLCAPTFGAEACEATRTPAHKTKGLDERWLLLLLLLTLSQNGGSKTLLVMLAYLIL